MIFGYSGFLGSHLLEHDFFKNAEKILPSRKLNNSRIEKATYVPFEKSFESIINLKPDIIINLIGVLREKYKGEYRKAHVDTVKEIIKSASTYNNAKIIHISAMGVGQECDSEYFSTKLEAEELLLKSGIQTVILRPGIIFGEGQKLFTDLKKISKFTPVIFCPNSKTSICDIKKIVKAIFESTSSQMKPGIYEVYDDVISFKDFFKKTIDFIGENKIVIEIPQIFLFPAAIIGEFTEISPLNMEQYKMLKCKAIPSGKFPTL